MNNVCFNRSNSLFLYITTILYHGGLVIGDPLWLGINARVAICKFDLLGRKWQDCDLSWVNGLLLHLIRLKQFLRLHHLVRLCSFTRHLRCFTRVDWLLCLLAVAVVKCENVLLGVFLPSYVSVRLFVINLNSRSWCGVQWRTGQIWIWVPFARELKKSQLLLWNVDFMVDLVVPVACRRVPNCKFTDFTFFEGRTVRVIPLAKQMMLMVGGWSGPDFLNSDDLRRLFHFFIILLVFRLILIVIFFSVLLLSLLVFLLASLILTSVESSSLEHVFKLLRVRLPQ